MILKEEARKLENKKFFSGHRTCAGCAIPIIIRHILAQTDYPIVASIATGCLEVTSTIHPYNCWNISCIHNAFENAAATISGSESAYKILKRKKKNLPKMKFIAFCGDGGAYDIGLQSISGALERRHDFTLVVYDNNAYQNTGGQRSSATPKGAWSTTTPVGKIKLGKEEERKNLMKILASHNLPYLAQAAVHDLLDLTEKAKKALNTYGPTALVILSPCSPMWGFPSSDTLEISKLAFETNFWPLYEIENRKYKITRKPSVSKPIEDFLKTQKRFSHLLKYQEKIKEIQESIDKEWEILNETQFIKKL